MRDQHSPHNLLTVPEVMDVLRVSRHTVRNLVQAGELVPVHFGRRVLFRRADVAALITHRAADPVRARQPLAAGR